jgi:hypothetical protein
VPDPNFAAVIALGRLDPDPAAVRDVLARLTDGRLAADRLVAGLELSKVGRLARHAVAAADPAPGPGRDLLRRLVEADEAEERWRERAVPPMRAAVTAAARHGGRVVKGLAVQSRYPRPELRHVGDVDLHFPSWAAARPLLRELRAAGWVWDTDELSWLKWHDSGVLYGQLSLVVDDNAAPYARVDLHVGPFSVGHAGLLPMAGWQPGTALGVPVAVPDTATALAMVAAHAVVDRVLSVKDLNDLRVLLDPARSDVDRTGVDGSGVDGSGVDGSGVDGSGVDRSGVDGSGMDGSGMDGAGMDGAGVDGADRVDWATVWELCRAAQAAGALAQCLRALAGAYPDLGRSVLPALPGGGGLGTTAPGAVRRAVAFAAHAYRDERARGSAVPAALRTGWTARRYFSGDLRPRLAAGPVRAAAPLPPLRRRDVCWRLVPAQLWEPWLAGRPDGPVDRPDTDRCEQLGDGLILVTGPAGVAVTLDGDVFVPTVWGPVPPGGARLAARLAGRIAAGQGVPG